MATSINISGVASFKKPAVLESSKRVNLIYGLNGTGKSTLSNFLYNQSDPEYENCHTNIDPTTKVLVYNQAFVRDYFYEVQDLQGIFGLSKENKEIDQKIAAAEGKLTELQQTGKNLQDSIESLEKTEAAHLAKAAERTWQIRRDYSGGDRVLEFCLQGLMGKKEVLFRHLSDFEKPSEKPKFGIDQIRRDAEAILSDSATAHVKFATITFDGGAVENDEVFSTVIVGNDDSPVADLIKKLGNSDWVHDGVTNFVFETGDEQKTTCPFCQQETLTTTLVKNIREYFDETYTKSLEHLETLEAKYASQIDQISQIETFENSPFAADSLPELREKLISLRSVSNTNLQTIRRKRDSPSTPEALEPTSAIVTEINNLISAINVAIDVHNQKIANQATEKTRLKSQFWSLMRWDYDQTLSTWSAQKKESTEKIASEKQKLEQARAAFASKRDEVAELQMQTVNIDGAVESINSSLEQLGISDFSIVRHTDVHYRLARAGSSEASFESLSEGEKMIISFLYFCELCRGKESVEETTQSKIAIIDDPVSSLSHIFIFNIGQMLKSDFFNSGLFDQVFVLTHSLYFFYELADADHKRRKENQSLFRLSKNSSGSTIAPMKYEQIQNDYQSYWVVALDPTQPPALVANCMRNIIEYFFGFVQKSSLSDVFDKSELKQNRFDAFSRYVNRESHSFGQNIFDLKEFDYESFREGLKLLFYAAGYPEHFEKMAKTIPS